MKSLDPVERSVAGEYLERLPAFLERQKDWWQESGQWLEGQYAGTIDASIQAARRLNAALEEGTGFPEDEGNRFLDALQGVLDITDKAESAVMNIHPTSIGWQHNDRIRGIARHALNGLTGRRDTWDRGAFSATVNEVLVKVAESAAGASLPELMLHFHRLHSDYGGSGDDSPFAALQDFLLGKSKEVAFRRLPFYEWAGEVRYALHLPSQIPVIDGRMFLCAALLVAFEDLHAAVDDKQRLTALCMALLESLAGEIEAEMHHSLESLLTDSGRQLLAGLQNPGARPEPYIRSRLHSDAADFAEADVLNYDLIAENLFTILKDEATNPPLNIGILAPWGRGKTSLMRRIEGKFRAERGRLLEHRSAGSTRLPTLGMLRQWLRNDDVGVRHNIPFATVWFNPWNYQSSDMIWAGLANSVIEQVVGQIPGKVDRELFWLQLRLARIDKDALRQDVQTRFLLFALNAGVWGITLLALIVLAALQLRTGAAPWGLLGIGGASGVGTLIASRLRPYNKPVTEVFSNYTKPPRYNEKLGTFHDVEADIHRVLDLCIDPEKPLVVFVDDLDRCSPSKIVEVIEAINVFISGRYNNKCYFILGMDAEVVAGALDVSYEKLRGRLASRELEQGSIGWYFLDKFIQLPFFIPVMSETKKRDYLDSLLSEPEGPGATNAKGPVDERKVAEVFSQVMATRSTSVSRELIGSSRLTAAEESHLEKMILRHQVQSRDEHEEIRRQVARFSRYLSSDPRSLKRFANLLRFHCGYQFLRMKKGQKYVEPDVLARWLVLMLKYPQLVRWIQWDLEHKSGSSITAEEKAMGLDKLIERFKARDGNVPADYEQWKKLDFPPALHPAGKASTIGDLEELSWLRAQGMFHILVDDYSVKDRLSQALECNVW